MLYEVNAPLTRSLFRLSVCLSVCHARELCADFSRIYLYRGPNSVSKIDCKIFANVIYYRPTQERVSRIEMLHQAMAICQKTFHAVERKVMNMKLVLWSLMGWLLHLVQRGGYWAVPARPFPSSLYQMYNSPQSIQGQCANHCITV